MFRLRSFSLIWLAILTMAGLSFGQAQSTSSRRSTITIHVGKSGLFSGFAHNHTISAPISRAAVDPKSKTASITVLTREMKVMDPDVSEKDRAEIQSTMLGPKVLDAQRFPEIRFTSTSIEQTDPQRFRVSGQLQLHGVTRRLEFPVSGTPEHYSGKTTLKQTDFGIQPISLAGGTVKVKDEVEIEFDVYPGQPQP
ncbi:MAG TPA: YceI family protein [Candidatus Angelobacter sp.]|nr:YceI family protein [Candidatus Angelobacter sp.]